MKPLTRYRAVFCTLFLALPLLVLRSAEAGGGDPARASKSLDGYFQSQLDSNQLVGISACVIKGDRVVWSGGYGVADIEKLNPVTPDVVFGLGSVSKTVTTAALMSLWEQGKFELDHDINTYLPFSVRNPRYPETPITFRMLLTHSSSISDMRPGKGTLPSLTEKKDSEMPVEEVLQGFLVPGGKLYADTNYAPAAPGLRYEYSNISFSLLGCLVERMSGKPFCVYCREALFDPLQMKESTWRLSEIPYDHFASVYRRDPQTGKNSRKRFETTWPGYMDGGLHASIAEFSNFIIMMTNRGSFRGKQVLKTVTLDTLLALQQMAPPPPGRAHPTLGQALLWLKSKVGEHEIYQMNGFGPGFFTEVYFDPKTRIGGAFFTTGEFSSFPAMGGFITATLDQLLAATGEL